MHKLNFEMKYNQVDQEVDIELIVYITLGTGGRVKNTLDYDQIVSSSILNISTSFSSNLTQASKQIGYFGRNSKGKKFMKW